MPIKSGELKGELTTAEIRKLIKAHNVLMSIKIPVGATRSQILKILDDKGYMVNHVRKSIQRRYKNERKPNVTLKQAEKITAPKKKTELQKQKMKEAKEAKEEKKKKDERAIRKKAVEEEKKRGAKKAPKPTAKKVSVGVGTEKKDDKKETKKKETKKKPKKIPIAALKEIARNFFNSTEDEFGANLEDVKRNLDVAGWSVIVGSGEDSEVPAGGEEYYKGMNKKEIADMNLKIRDRVIKYAIDILNKKIKEEKKKAKKK
tara:strand:- start:862 stop:1641 length:780 start_codon:yes stop_codon:yes gene_type:complete